jgi:hypothetical protein
MRQLYNPGREIPMSEKTLKKEDLRAWIARMRERDEWPETDLELMQAIEDVLDSHDELGTRLKSAEETLAFYGDPETYFAIGFLPDRPCGEFEDDFEELDGALGHPGGGSWTKPGKRARAYFKDAYIEGAP